MRYPSDLTTEPWRIVRLALANNSKWGRKHGRDLRKMERLELVLVDKGTSERRARALSKQYGVEVRRVFWDEKPVDPRTGERVFKPLPYAWRVEVAHGQLGRSRRLAKSFENSTDSATAWLQLACIARVLGAIS